MKQMRYTFLLVGLLGLSATKAQVFEALPSTDRILIGAPFLLQLDARVPAGSDFLWPQFQTDTLKEFEILEFGTIDTTVDNGMWHITQNLQLTSFDSGYFVTPPLQLVVGSDTLFSDPVLVQVNMPEIAPDMPMYDIKDLQSAPIDWVRVLWISLFVLLGLLCVYLIYRMRKLKNAPQKSFAIAPITPPHEVALAALAVLKKQALWEREAFKAHYDELTHIFREYLAKRFKIAAMELTSTELQQLMRAKGLLYGMDESIKQLLNAADMAKFAKGRTDALTAQTMLDLVAAYVNQTKEAPQNSTKHV